MIKEISQNQVRTSYATLTINKDGIILMLNPRNFKTILRLDETRSINSIQGYDIRKVDNAKIVTSEMLTSILNNTHDEIKLILTDEQKNKSERMIKENYRHKYLLDIAIHMFEFDELNKLEKEIKNNISIDEMRAIVLKYDLENSLKQKSGTVERKTKI